MPELTTDPSLLTALARAATRAPTREQVDQQRISFIMGSLPGESDITREEVQHVLRQQAGSTVQT